MSLENITQKMDALIKIIYCFFRAFREQLVFLG
jgi:hypothetical protein